MQLYSIAMYYKTHMLRNYIPDRVHTRHIYVQNTLRFTCDVVSYIRGHIPDRVHTRHTLRFTCDVVSYIRGRIPNRVYIGFIRRPYNSR